MERDKCRLMVCGHKLESIKAKIGDIKMESKKFLRVLIDNEINFNHKSGYRNASIKRPPRIDAPLFRGFFNKRPPRIDAPLKIQKI